MRAMYAIRKNNGAALCDSVGVSAGGRAKMVSTVRAKRDIKMEAAPPSL